MTYCTADDLEAVIGRERLAQLTDFDKVAPGTINASRVAAACEAASSMIDSYAAKRYSVPFEAPSSAIKRTAIRLAIYDLIEQSPAGPTPEQIAEQGLRLKWLDDLAAGKVTPGTTPSPAAHTMIVDRAIERPDTKDVSRRKTRGYW